MKPGFHAHPKASLKKLAKTQNLLRLLISL